jgi:adenylate cyclase
VYGRARVLCERAGRLDALVQVLVGLFAYHFVRAELRPASAIAAQLLRIADRQGANGDAHARLAADAAMGVSSLATGALAAAHEHLERVIRAYDPARHARLAITFGQDFGVVGLAYSALLLWLSGCPDQARSRADQAVALAERLHHPHSIALALSLGASVHYFARDAAAVAAWAHRLDELAAAQGFGHWQAEARFLLAWVAAEEGRSDEALEVMETQIAAFRALDSLMPFQYHFRSLAELHARAGRPEHARALLDELERTIDAAGEGWWWESEVYRARGDVMTMLDDEAAEAAYSRALEVARARRARSLELRAAIGLARLWIERGRTGDARALLSDCYEGFTEGFDTGDLRETRALLRQLDAHVVV